ncbi:MAG: heme ABC exporter ATP-binding protein CcmA [Steroidobacteraceae bacterium]
MGSIPTVRTTTMKELAVEHLHVWRGDTHLLRNLSFSVRSGQCLQVTGRNGAGKTTLLRALCGLTPLESGSVRWCGTDTQRERGVLHRELAYLGHDPALKGELSARENLYFAANLRRQVSMGAIDAALEQVELTARGRPVRQLSAGQRRRVALAGLLLLECALWVLDEPTSNLDVRGQQLVGELLGAHLQGGGLVLIATHQALELDPARLMSLELT